MKPFADLAEIAQNSSTTEDFFKQLPDLLKQDGLLLPMIIQVQGIDNGLFAEVPRPKNTGPLDARPYQLWQMTYRVLQKQEGGSAFPHLTYGTHPQNDIVTQNPKVGPIQTAFYVDGQSVKVADLKADFGQCQTCAVEKGHAGVGEMLRPLQKEEKLDLQNGRYIHIGGKESHKPPVYAGDRFVFVNTPGTLYTLIRTTPTSHHGF